MKYGDFPEVKAKCVEWKDSLPACSHHLSLLIDIFEQEGTPESITHASEVSLSSSLLLFPSFLFFSL